MLKRYAAPACSAQTGTTSVSVVALPTAPLSAPLSATPGVSASVVHSSAVTVVAPPPSSTVLTRLRIDEGSTSPSPATTLRG